MSECGNHMPLPSDSDVERRRRTGCRKPGGAFRPTGFGAGATVGILGGLVGLGGAEFRLPLLLTVFGFAALAAVIVNKAMSLVVVVAAMPARLSAVPLSQVADEWGAVVNLLAGSLLGAWLGASWATRMASATLYRVLAILLVSSRSCSPPNDSAPFRPRTSPSRCRSSPESSRGSASASSPP